MEKNKKKQKSVLPIAIFFVNLLKMLILASTVQLGIDFYKIDINITYKSVIFWCCALVLSTLSAVFYTTASKKHTESANILFALLMLDPSVILVIRMTQCLLLYVLAYLVLINESREKPLVNREFLLVLFSFAASFVFAHSVFSFVPFAVAAYLIARRTETNGRTRTVLTVFATLVFVILGIVLNKQLQLSEINMYLNALPVSDNNSRLLMGLSVPYAVFAIVFVYLCATVKTPKTVKRNKNAQQAESNTSSIIPVITAAVYLLSFVGGFCGYAEALCMINASIPLLLLLSLRHDDTKTEKTMHIMTAFIHNHFFAFIIAAVCICYVAIRVILRFGIADNTIAFLITAN
ncbi:MAG: hypothetical protein E7523_06395 [Ruminococcaceae bacterium]|nr:hypothetical protein [Oscillospiraceae bacterium]